MGINPTDFADIPISNLLQLTLPVLVKTRREEKNISVEDLSERIGYYADVIEAIEKDRKDVVVYLDALKEIAKELDIPFRLLLEKI